MVKKDEGPIIVERKARIVEEKAQQKLGKETHLGTPNRSTVREAEEARNLTGKMRREHARRACGSVRLGTKCRRIASKNSNYTKTKSLFVSEAESTKTTKSLSKGE
jgi:hypothetical protein